jgi:hypothetical protein
MFHTGVSGQLKFPKDGHVVVTLGDLAGIVQPQAMPGVVRVLAR